MKRLLKILFFFFAFLRFQAVPLFCLAGCLFTFHLKTQWVQQTLPVSAQPFDMVFFDANTGLISLSNSPPLLYRTTDGGFNWSLVNYIRIFKFDKIDSQAVYGNGRTYLTDDIIYRSYNRGTTWDSVAVTPAAYSNLSFINRDTGWVCGHNGSVGAIWKTTNGGVTLVSQLASGTSGMDRIFFLPQRINGEYTGWCSQSSFFRKTTNSGASWFVAAAQYADQIFFVNKDTGWVCNGLLYKTINGGVNWINQPMPTDASIVSNSIFKFTFVNSDYGWGTGGIRFFGGGQFRGIIWKTTNGGLNWGYQQPDTIINVFQYDAIYFIDTLIGWSANASGNKLIHTTNGGGPIIYTAVNQISTNIPKEYKLFQNYPNPFNPKTIIRFQITRLSDVKIIVFDVTGRLAATLVDEEKSAGTYEIDWNPQNLSSGIYFYSLSIDGVTVDTKKLILIK